VRLGELCWSRYRLPFVAGFSTAHGAMRVREGLILQLTTDDGTIGLGEAAPLVEFGGGDCDLTEGLLRSLLSDLRTIELDELIPFLKARFGERPESAALRCGLDTAVLDSQAKARGLPLAALLTDDMPAATVAVNATIGEPDGAAAIAKARAALAHGFRTIKLKIGLGRTLQDEIRRVAAMRDALGPECALRLDANGAWSVDEACAILPQLVPYGIEYVEQPVPAHDLAGLAHVRRCSLISIAADEALTGPASARRIIEQHAADVLILKPMVCGGLRACRAIIDFAAAAGIRTVVTSTIDSGIGVAAALHLAATLPPNSPACGLATSDLLTGDLLAEPLTVAHGAMLVPNVPGLGVKIDQRQLARRSPGAKPPG
jgi:o-succinylbenzoate synthase